jgi:hypothetical protein
MSSNMRAFRTVVACVGVSGLIALFPVGVHAQSSQGQPAQPLAAAEPSSGAGAGQSTVLKTPDSPSSSVSYAPAQSIPGTPPQSPAISAAGQLSSKPSPSLINGAITYGGPVATTAGAGTVASSSVATGAGSASAIQTKINGLEFLTPAERETFARAASSFTVFCHDWERLLHEREINNLEHLTWQTNGGLEIATYTGYGKVESCECKESEGLPIGKIRYKEINYSIAGKTVDEARHAMPKSTHEISTLEIFSWDKGKWFY